jgi:L-fucono-1,5-lactonase
MRIDAHQHFWRYNPKEYEWIDDPLSALRRDFLPEHIEPELTRAGFDACVAVQARQSLEETQWLLELAGAWPFVYGVVGWIDLRSPDAASQLAKLAQNPKLLGVRHIVQSEPDDRFLLQPEFLRGIAALEQFGLTYDILIYARHLPVAAEFVRRFPRQRFVLDHLAKPPIRSGALRPWSEDLRRLASSPNVLCKLSGLVTEAEWNNWKHEHIVPYIDVAMDCFGPERLMIGSDWPVCTAAAPYPRTMEVVIDYLAGFSEKIRDAVLGGTAERFWSSRLTQASALKSEKGRSI